MVPPRNSTINVSQDVSLACRAEAYPANLTYTWLQDGINVFHIRCGSAGCGAGVTGGPSLQSPSADHGLGPSAACSHACRSWWMGAYGCRRPSPMTPDATPARPATASCGHPRPPPPSPCSVSLTPAPAPGLAPRPQAQRALPAQLAAVSPHPRPSPGDCNAS